MTLLPLLFNRPIIYDYLLLNYAAICGIVLSRIWRNLYRNTEIDRNWRSEELLKFGGGQRGFPYEGEVRKFSENWLALQCEVSVVFNISSS